MKRKECWNWARYIKKKKKRLCNVKEAREEEILVAQRQLCEASTNIKYNPLNFVLD